MKSKIINQMITMFTASIAFVSALAWNEAVQSLFNKMIFFQDKRIVARFIYAIFVTIIAVIMSTFLSKHIKDEVK